MSTCSCSNSLTYPFYNVSNRWDLDGSKQHTAWLNSFRRRGAHRWASSTVWVTRPRYSLTLISWPPKSALQWLSARGRSIPQPFYHIWAWSNESGCTRFHGQGPETIGELPHITSPPHSTSTSRTGPSQWNSCPLFLLHFLYLCLKHIVNPASPLQSFEMYPISVECEMISHAQRFLQDSWVAAR